jgi:uncharacterized membrane protein
MDASDSDRITRLEREIAILRAEFAKLREQLRASGASRPAEAPRPASSEPPRPTPPRVQVISTAPRRSPSFSPPKDRQSFEEVIGRYGTIVVATITVLVGVGIFLNWAIQHNLLGPTARVILGYAGALGLAYGGVRMRLRGTREFGNILLAMALGVVHLVCWSAGPLLHVLPSTVALAIGFLGSVVLAEFALRHDEEALCAIGFGGAAIAPFITSSDSGNVIALAVYGVIVVALSAASLRDRRWSSARGVTIVSFALYVVVIASANPPHTAWPGIVSRLGILFPLAVLIAIIPLVHAVHRRQLIRVATGAVAVGGIVRGNHGGDLWSAALVIAATLIGIGALDVFRPDAVERDDAGAADPLATHRSALLDALLLPMGLFMAAIVALPGAVSRESAIVGLVWSVLAIVMTERSRAESESDMYASTATLTALWIVPAAIPSRYDSLRIAGFIVLGLALLGLAVRIPRRPFAAGGLGALTIASLWGLAKLEDRPPFTYAPFATWESLVLLAAIAGWLVARRLTRRREFVPTLTAENRALMDGFVVVATSATAFLWVRAELAGAWNVTASTALLIVYYVTTGTFMIWLGRQRAVKPLRVIGLLLALLAAGKALAEAFQVPNVAVRIAIFFAVSAFLIAVGYWYRRGGEEILEPAAAIL